jgi:hypothetical protein
VADDTLTLALHGDVSLDAFADAVGRWRELVDTITRKAALERDVTWVISELSAGSATVTARAVGDEEAVPQVTHAYLEVGRSLASGQVTKIPSDYRADALSLAGVLKLHGAIDFMRFETAEADTIITTNWDALLTEALAATEHLPAVLPEARGAVQGRIQTLTSRHGLRFTLYDTLFDKAVGCYLSEGQEEIMRDLWGRAAIVEGVVTRDPATGRPLAIRHVTDATAVREVTADVYLRARGAVSRASDDEREPEELISASRDG